jgi:hypothetical protein
MTLIRPSLALALSAALSVRSKNRIFILQKRCHRLVHRRLRKYEYQTVVASAHPKQGQDRQCEIPSAAAFDLGLGFGKRAAVAETYRQDADVKRIWRLF